MSDILESLNNLKELNLWNDILTKLGSFGYEVKETDVQLLVLCANNVEQQIKLECNITKIVGFDFGLIDRICGEFLSIKASTNTLDISTLDLNGAISSLSMGDTSVSYDNATNDNAKFNTLIDALKNKGDLTCLRKIRF